MFAIKRFRNIEVIFKFSYIDDIFIDVVSY